MELRPVTLSRERRELLDEAIEAWARMGSRDVPFVRFARRVKMPAVRVTHDNGPLNEAHEFQSGEIARVENRIRYPDGYQAVVMRVASGADEFFVDDRGQCYERKP